MLRSYEISLILNSQLAEDAIDGAIERCEGFLTGEGATVVDVNRMGVRKLAYEVGKHQQGFYTFIKFEAEPQILPELERLCKLEESVLRHMVLVNEGRFEDVPPDTAVEASEAVDTEADARELPVEKDPAAGETEE